METQQAGPAHGKGSVKSSTARYEAPPMVNEVAAIGIGKFLTDASNSVEDKAKVRETLQALEKVNIVYEQNTADVINVVVPDFEGLEANMAQALADADLEHIAGGEIGISIGLFFGSIGIGLAAVLGLKAVTCLGAGSVLAGVLGAAVVIGSVGATVAAAGAVAGIGVGIAAAVGAFEGGSDVNVGHAS